MSADGLIAALGLPPAALVGQRVPKKLLLEHHGAPTAADKRLVAEGIDAIHWLAALKPANCGVPDYRDGTREYLEIAVLRLGLRSGTREARLVELLHRAVPYPVVLVVEAGPAVSLSLAHKRAALKEADKVVLDGDPMSADVPGADTPVGAAFLQALALDRQPRASLLALYQGWMDTVTALQAAVLTGTFTVLDSAERLAERRESLRTVAGLQARIAKLRRDAVKTSQLARQVELNIEIKRLQAELAAAHARL